MAISMQLWMDLNTISTSRVSTPQLGDPNLLSYVDSLERICTNPINELNLVKTDHPVDKLNSIIRFPIPSKTPNHRTPSDGTLHCHMTEHRHCLIQTTKLSIHLQKSIASEQAAVEAILDHNCMHHATVLPRTQVSITRNQAHKGGLGRLHSIHIPRVVKQPHDLAQAPSADVSTNYRIPCHRVPSWHSVEHPTCGAHVVEQCSALKREAQGEVSPEHGIVEERLGRRRGGCRDGEVEHPTRGIGVAEARVAGDEEGCEVAIGGEAGDSGERVRATRVSHREVSVTCAVCSTVSSSLTLMTVAIHGSIGLRGITTWTSHLSWPWAIDMWLC
jgi:hypothetical protein